MARMSGIATEAIPFGASVLCRAFRVSLAAPEVANGTAKARRLYGCDKPVYDAGHFVDVEPIEGLGQRDLHALANGPIMDPRDLYLPAGKISLAEAKARETANLDHPHA